MAGLSDQPMAAGKVVTNGVAAPPEGVAQGQTRAYGRFAFGRTPFINFIVLGIVSLVLGSLLSSQASGLQKPLVFAIGFLVLPALVWFLRGLYLRRQAADKDTSN